MLDISWLQSGQCTTVHKSLNRHQIERDRAGSALRKELECFQKFLGGKLFQIPPQSWLHAYLVPTKGIPSLLHSPFQYRHQAVHLWGHNSKLYWASTNTLRIPTYRLSLSHVFHHHRLRSTTKSITFRVYCLRDHKEMLFSGWAVCRQLDQATK